ncbi:MAG: serine/threonine protein kinase, partial [Acidobacteria bacterium]
MGRRGIGIGSTIAGRRLEAEIGRGGMGVVYRAENDRLDRMEAVKVIADDLARDRGFRERFLREAMIAVAVEHPHVIPVYDADEAAGG